MLRNRSFDISFLWSNILKIINKLHDSIDERVVWLLHEIFYLKFSQVVHFHAFGTNMRSSYAEIVIKENFINETANSRNNVTLVDGEGNIDRLEVMAIPSNELTGTLTLTKTNRISNAFWRAPKPVSNRNSSICFTHQMAAVCTNCMLC